MKINGVLFDNYISVPGKDAKTQAVTLGKRADGEARFPDLVIEETPQGLLLKVPGAPMRLVGWANVREVAYEDVYEPPPPHEAEKVPAPGEEPAAVPVAKATAPATPAAKGARA